MHDKLHNFIHIKVRRINRKKVSKVKKKMSLIVLHIILYIVQQSENGSLHLTRPRDPSTRTLCRAHTMSHGGADR